MSVKKKLHRFLVALSSSLFSRSVNFYRDLACWLRWCGTFGRMRLLPASYWSCAGLLQQQAPEIKTFAAAAKAIWLQSQEPKAL